MICIYIQLARMNGWLCRSQPIPQCVVRIDKSEVNHHQAQCAHMTTLQTNWTVQSQRTWGNQQQIKSLRQPATGSETKASPFETWMCLLNSKRHSHSTTTGKSNSTLQRQWPCRILSSSKTTTLRTSMYTINRWRKKEWTWVVEWEVKITRLCHLA